MTLNEIITYAQKHKIDFDKPVKAVLKMNEALPLTISACHGSIKKNVVLHVEPIEICKKWRIEMPENK